MRFCSQVPVFIHQRIPTYTVRQLYDETDFILTKIEVLTMKQCMPSMWSTFICNLATPQRPMLSMTGKCWVFWNAYGRGFAMSGPSTQHQAVGFFFTTMHRFTGQLLYKNFLPKNKCAPSSAPLPRFIPLWLYSVPPTEVTIERVHVWRCSRHPSSCDIESSGHTTRRCAEVLPVC